jgi:hypothetical protein
LVSTGKPTKTVYRKPKKTENRKTMQTKNLISSIETAIPVMPYVLSRIIGQYADEKNHTWTTSNPFWQIETKQAETRIQYVGKPVGTGLPTWHRFASTTTIRNGALNWTVNARLDGYVGVGVTTASECYVEDGGFIASSLNTWIIRISSSNFVVYNGRQTTVNQAIDRFVQSPIHFAADPKTMQISARFLDFWMTGYKDVVLMTAKDADEFYAIRPYIVIGDVHGAMLLSGR